MPQKRLSADGLTMFRGLCMGGADVVPGVSGGTVALIFGIYERLVTAISHFDLRLLGHLRQRQWRSAAQHIDLRFLVALGMGIVVGLLAMSAAMHHLLTHDTTRAVTLAVFFGMILASAIVVGKMIEFSRGGPLAVRIGLGLAGAALAFWLTKLQQANPAAPGYLYLFLCGAVAICAMILPGISGAMVLLLMGVYVHLTEIPKNLLRGNEVPEGVITIIVFGAGCAIGLISFSKLLRWLLARHKSDTMALLCGFMIGALRKIWPFQRDVSPDEHEFKLKQFELYLPEQFSTDVGLVLLATVAAAAGVFVVDGLTRRRKAKDRD